MMNLSKLLQSCAVVLLLSGCGSKSEVTLLGPWANNDLELNIHRRDKDLVVDIITATGVIVGTFPAEIDGNKVKLSSHPLFKDITHMRDKDTVLIGGVELSRGSKRPGLRHCQERLVMISGAKELWALEHKKKSGEQVTMKDIVAPDDSTYLKTEPKCPADGTYTVNPIGVAPTCSFPGHVIPPE